MATYNSCKQLVVPRWDVLAFRKNRDVFWGDQYYLENREHKGPAPKFTLWSFYQNEHQKQSI